LERVAEKGDSIGAQAEKGSRRRKGSLGGRRTEYKGRGEKRANKGKTTHAERAEGIRWSCRSEKEILTVCRAGEDERKRRGWSSLGPHLGVDLGDDCSETTTISRASYSSEGREGQGRTRIEDRRVGKRRQVAQSVGLAGDNLPWKAHKHHNG
jgi:hypothetical protein